MRSIGHRPSHATVVSYLALFVALGGTGAYAAGTVFSEDIVDGEVKAPDLASSAVATATLAGNAVTGPKVLDGSLTASDLGTGSVTNSKLGPNAVTSSRIATGAVAESDVQAAVLGRAFRTRRNSPVVVSSDNTQPTELARLTLGPGKYIIHAKTRIEVALRASDCTLRTGSGSILDRASFGHIDGKEYVATPALLSDFTLAPSSRPTTVRLFCSGGGQFLAIQAFDVKLTAIRTGVLIVTNEG